MEMFSFRAKQVQASEWNILFIYLQHYVTMELKEQDFSPPAIKWTIRHADPTQQWWMSHSLTSQFHRIKTHVANVFSCLMDLIELSKLS